MAKNILIFSTSPRKGGNSDILCDEFMRGAQDAGHQAEKILLRKMTVNYCIGCDVCRKNGGTCAQKDDMAGILDKMIAADVLVMATPVYFYSMCAQMKTLIDRVYAKYTEVQNKEMYLIATAADSDKTATERTIEGFRGFVVCLKGSSEKGIISGTGAWEGRHQKQPGHERGL